MRATRRLFASVLAVALTCTGVTVLTATSAEATPAPWTIVEKSKTVALPRPGEVSDFIACDPGYTPISGGTTWLRDRDKAQRRYEYVEWGSGAAYHVYYYNPTAPWGGSTPQFTLYVRCVSLSTFPNGMVQVDTLIPRGSNNLAVGMTNPCPAGRIAISASLDWNGNANGLINTTVPDYEFDQWYVSGYNSTAGTSMFVSTHCVSTQDVAGARLYTGYSQIASQQTVHGRLCPSGMVPLAGGQFMTTANGGGPDLGATAHTMFSRPINDGWEAWTPYQSIGVGSWVATTLWCQPKHGISVFASSAPYPNPNSNQARWTMTVTDQSAGGGYGYSFTCSLDGSAPFACTSPWTSGVLSDGNHTLSVTATSSDGRTSSTSSTLKIDATPPVLTLIEDNKPIINTSSTSLWFTGSDSTGWQAKCWADSGTQTICASGTWNSGHLTDGPHVLHVLATDGRGSTTQADFAVQVDTVAPVVSVTGKPPAATTSTSASFTIGATDESPSSGSLTMECRLDGASFAACPATKTFSSLTDGTHTFQVRATDPAQNQTLDTTTWKVDTVAPVITVDPANATASDSSSPSFAFGVSDATSGVASTMCWVDSGTPATCTSPYSPPAPLADGAHTLHIRSTDNASNQSEAALNFAVDTAAPTVSVTGLPGTLSKTAAASISVSATDSAPSAGGLVVTCHLDDAADTPCPSTTTLVDLAQGAHTFFWKAVDAAGNETLGSHTWSVDTIAPVVTVGGKPAAVTDSQSATFTVAATDTDGSGVTSLLCHLDGAADGTDCASKSYASLPAGTHTFYWSATDAAGNVTTGSHAWRIDLAAPAVTITSGPASWSNQSTATFGFVGPDDGPTGALTYKCSWDAAAFVDCATPSATKTGLGLGSHSFVVIATDALGRQGLATRNWTIETAPPSATMTAPTQPFSLSTSVPLKWSGSDSGGSGLKAWEVQRRGGAWNADLGAWPAAVTTYPAATTTISATGLAAGATYCWRVRAVDTAGNRSSWSQRCTAVVLDDRALTASPGWVRGTQAGYFAGTRTETKTLGATLTRTGARLTRVAVLATKCSTCGSVRVYVNGIAIGTINLYAATTSRSLITLPAFSLRTATVTLRVMSSGKLVRIDGVGLGKV